jgi:hypothetical protein
MKHMLETCPFRKGTYRHQHLSQRKLPSALSGAYVVAA